MPEGPEVRRYALALNETLGGQEIVAFTARTKAARAWLAENVDRVIGRRLLEVRSHGKHLFGRVEGGIGFHSHLMMWGRWQLLGANQNPEPDRRERARIVTPGAIALLLSAPVFEIFDGEPYECVENLASLGPDILPYEGEFDRLEFERRLLVRANRDREIGAALLDQTICAGVGNYLRADLLFVCRIDPWKKAGELERDELDALTREIPLMARRSLEEAGVSIPPPWRERLLAEPSLHYNGSIREWAARHAVFRRTNLPCLLCGEPIRQQRQITARFPTTQEPTQEPTLESGGANTATEAQPQPQIEEVEKTRVIYFCPACQNVDPTRWLKESAKASSKVQTGSRRKRSIRGS